MIWHFALFLSVGLHVPPDEVSAGNCRPQSGVSNNVVTFLTEIVTRGDPGNIKLRQAYNLPAVSTTPAVTLVADDAECAKAAAALQAFYNDGVSSAPVWVFKIGTSRIAAVDGSLEINVFDTSYNHLALLVGL